MTVELGYVPPTNLPPTIDDVAALIRARTKDGNGNELGTFTSDTRPTDVQVQVAIDHQLILIHTQVGRIGDTCADLGRMAAAIGAAAEIELSYYPEQIASDRSAYVHLVERYAEAMSGLVACVQGNLPDAAGTDDDNVPDGLRYGTIDAISGVVHAHYTGRTWPALPNPSTPPASDA